METSEYRGLRWKIIAITLAFSLIPLFVLGYVIHVEYSRTYHDKIAANLRTIVSNKRAAVDMFLDERVSQLKTLAYTHTFREMSDSEYLSDLFQRIQGTADSFVDLGVIDAAGDHVSYVGPYNLGDVNYSDAEWFHEVMLKGLYISDMFMGFRKFPHFIIAVMRREGNSSWILRATIDSDVFTRLVKSVQVGQRGDAYLVNQANVLQTPSRFSGEVLAKVSLPPEDRFEGVRITGMEVGEVPMIVGRTWLEETDWVLVIMEDPLEEMSPLIRARWIMAAAVALAALLIFAGAFVVSGSVVNKIVVVDRRKAATDAQLMHSSKMAALGKLAAGVAHEVNNPLTLIREGAGWIKDLITDQDPSEIKHYDEIAEALDKIDVHVERARNITHRMLGFAKRMDPVQESVDLANLADQTLKFLENECLHRNIEVVRDYAQALPMISTDPAQVQQVVLNIVENAIDAIGKDGKVTLATSADEDSVSLAISDTGPGINSEVLNKIFDPFFSTKKVGEGTGLGLAISYGIIEKLGGRISARSTPGEGSSFIISLPLERT